MILILARASHGVVGGEFRFRAFESEVCTESKTQKFIVVATNTLPVQTAIEATEVWLREFLGTGSVPVKVIEEFARQRGHQWATVRRAKTALGVETVKQGLQGGWARQMPKTLK
jgi:hypothetical protein